LLHQNRQLPGAKSSVQSIFSQPVGEIADRTIVRSGNTCDSDVPIRLAFVVGTAPRRRPGTASRLADAAAATPTPPAQCPEDRVAATLIFFSPCQIRLALMDGHTSLSPDTGRVWRCPPRRRSRPQRIAVLCVEPDSADPDRVVVHDADRNVANMTVAACVATCAIMPTTIVLTDRLAT
jgi:hypothetical protein